MMFNSLILNKVNIILEVCFAQHSLLFMHMLNINRSHLSSCALSVRQLWIKDSAQAFQPLALCQHHPLSGWFYAI